MCYPQNLLRNISKVGEFIGRKLGLDRHTGSALAMKSTIFSARSVMRLASRRLGLSFTERIAMMKPRDAMKNLSMKR